MQIFKKKDKENETTSVLKDLANKEKQASTKILNVQHKSCCGCGCDYVDYKIEVPIDSDIEEDDIVSWDTIEKYEID